MTQYQAALFDLDGVVFDTEPQYTIFWGNECRRYHPEIPGLEQKIKGQTLNHIYEMAFADVKDEQPLITERLNEFERNMSFDYVAGFEDYIKRLQQAGVKTAVVTSSNIAKMQNVYKQHPEFESYFDRIFTSEDFKRSKPFPDCYLLGAETFGVAPERCLVFEDSINGLKSGRAAGMHVVGLTTTNPEEVVKPLSDEMIADFQGFERM